MASGSEKQGSHQSQEESGGRSTSPAQQGGDEEGGLDQMSEGELDRLLQAEKEKQVMLEVSTKRREKENQLRQLREANWAMEQGLKPKVHVRKVKAKKGASGRGHVKPLSQEDITSKVANLLAGEHKQDDGESGRMVSESSSSDSEVSIPSRRRKSKGTVKSGVHDTMVSQVRAKQFFPQAALQSEFLGGKSPPNYHTLNFHLFVAGELEVILGGTRSKEECKARLLMLKKTAYRADYVSWNTLRDLHEAILRKIEVGQAAWTSDFETVERQVLERAKMGGQALSNTDKKGVDTKNTPVYCKEFNKGTCTFSESHRGLFYGNPRKLLHVCSDCLGKGKQLPHRKGQDECPEKKSD